MCYFPTSVFTMSTVENSNTTFHHPTYQQQQQQSSSNNPSSTIPKLSIHPPVTNSTNLTTSNNNNNNNNTGFPFISPITPGSFDFSKPCPLSAQTINYNNNNNSSTSKFPALFKSPSPTTLTFNQLPNNIHKQTIDTLQPTDYDLIVDIRGYNLYTINRITNAINCCIPTTLLKRNSTGLETILNQLINLSTDLKSTILGYLKSDTTATATATTNTNTNNTNNNNSLMVKKLNVLIYDHNSNYDFISFNLYHTILKFNQFINHFNISYLEGGFYPLKNDIEKYHHLIDDSDISNNNNNIGNFSTMNNSKLQHRKAKSLSGLTLPMITKTTPNNNNNTSTTTSTNNNNINQLSSSINNSFLQSIHKKSNGNDEPILEELRNYQLKIPQSLQNIPNWLHNVHLYENFEKLENFEKTSINNIFNSSSSTTATTTTTTSKLGSPIGKFGNNNNSNNDDDNDNDIISPCCMSCQKIEFNVPRGIEYGYKNRYKNIWPYDHSRVKLTAATINNNNNSHNPPSSPSSCSSSSFIDDYFNGNFINTNSIIPNNQFTYIATQKPLSSTISDFWNIINHENIQIIINLDYEPINYFNYKEFIKLIKPIPEKTDNTKKVYLINEKIYYIQYLSWPDFSIPQDYQSFLNLINLKNEITAKYDLNKKILVHCSAGCGRTGVFITLDSLIQGIINKDNDNDKDKPEEDGEVDGEVDGVVFDVYKSSKDLIYKLIQHQRKQRISMVQNYNQFIACYEIFIKFLINHEKDYQQNQV